MLDEAIQAWLFTLIDDIEPLLARLYAAWLTKVLP